MQGATLETSSEASSMPHPIRTCISEFQTKRESAV